MSRAIQSICSSVNEIACHGIPDDRPLEDGDIVSFDISVYYEGFHGDNCATVTVGDVDREGRRLVQATQEALTKGIEACRPGGCLTKVGEAIHQVADNHGYQTVSKYCGHGVAQSFHMLPLVHHCRNDRQQEMFPGMTFTIEPIFTEHSEETGVWDDDWTVHTVDGGRAAQFEHVVLITDDGAEVLTV